MGKEAQRETGECLLLAESLFVGHRPTRGPASFTRAVISLVIFPWAPALERLTHMCAISDLYEEPTAGRKQK
jgi:hypothetical protein